MKQRMISVILVIAMTLAIAGGAYLADRIVVTGEKGHYTYSYAGEAPDTWNPLEWSGDEAQEVLEYTTSPLYTVALNEGRDGYTVEAMLAAGMPEDVTAAYAGNETYGISGKAAEGYAWRITLRSDILWENGTQITTADFASSLQQYLSPQSGHEHSVDYFRGTTALANAQAYYHSGMTPVYTKEDGAAKVEDGTLYFSLTQQLPFLGNVSMKEYHAYYSPDYKTDFRNTDGSDLYEALADYVKDAVYTPADSTIQGLLEQFCSNLGMKKSSWKNACFYTDDAHAVSWEQVGFVAEDDQTMTLILNHEVTQEQLCYALSDLYLLKADLYEKEQEEYGTNASAYMSYGPYRIVDYDPQTGITLARNENWFGYGDERYAGQYQTTDIVIDYQMDRETALTLFEQGNLQRVRLSQVDLAAYGQSEYYHAETTGEMIMYNLNSDLTDLQRENTDTQNHAILGYRDFRNALALALDKRSYLAGSVDRGAAVYGIVNDTYISDTGQNIAYRSTASGQAALKKVYGTDDPETNNTYDMEKASKLIQSAYDVCLADGNIHDYDTVVLTFYSQDSEVGLEKDIEFLQNAINLAAVGTDLEGRIVVREAEAAEDGSVKADICKCVWSGNFYDPFQFLQNFIDTDAAKTAGLYPDIRKVAITINDKVAGRTYTEWYELLVNGKYHTADTEIREKVMRYLEQEILKNYTVIPFYGMYNDYLYSKRISLGSMVCVNARLGCGGVRYMTYSMDDAVWADYCMEQDCMLYYK